MPGLTYSAGELLKLRRYDVTPPRQTRKVIFRYRLWQPRIQRQQQQLTQTGLPQQPSSPHLKRGRRRRAARQPRHNEAASAEVPVGRSSTLLASPSLYVLNAAALSKPGATEHLAADLSSYNVDVAVITETHFKAKHADSVVGVDGYTVFRRDRAGRRGGGVALYVRSSIQSTVWMYSADNRTYELQWVRIGDTFVAALYHPPAPIYSQDDLLDYIEACVEELSRDFPAAPIVLAGDLNQLSDEDIVERTGLTQIVHQPTRGANILDRVLISDPQLYTTVRVVASVVKSDHKAVVVYADRSQCAQLKKTTFQRTYRPKTPTQHAMFLQQVAAIEVNNQQPFNNSQTPADTQIEFDVFYTTALSLLNQHYPERTITVTSRDPEYVTLEIKAKLRRKNRLNRAGQVEEAAALAELIGKDIA